MEAKENSLADGINQLKGYRGQKSKYLGVPLELVGTAIEQTQGTGSWVLGFDLVLQ